MSILGTRVVRIEDPRFLRGEGTYIANLPLDGAVPADLIPTNGNCFLTGQPGGRLAVWGRSY